LPEIPAAPIMKVPCWISPAGSGGSGDSWPGSRSLCASGHFYWTVYRVLFTSSTFSGTFFLQPHSLPCPHASRRSPGGDGSPVEQSPPLARIQIQPGGTLPPLGCRGTHPTHGAGSGTPMPPWGAPKGVRMGPICSRPRSGNQNLIVSVGAHTPCPPCPPAKKVKTPITPCKSGRQSLTRARFCKER
jgi:hypothetical protein